MVVGGLQGEVKNTKALFIASLVLGLGGGSYDPIMNPLAIIFSILWCGQVIVIMDAKSGAIREELVKRMLLMAVTFVAAMTIGHYLSWAVRLVAG